MSDTYEHPDSTSPTTEDAPARSPRMGRRVAAVGLIGALATTAVAVPAFAGAETATVDPARRVHDTETAAEAELGDLTLDRLADELARLGLRLEIEPATTGEWDDAWPEDEGEWDDAWPEDEGEWDDAWPEDEGEWDDARPEDQGGWEDDEEPAASFDVEGDRLVVPSGVDAASAAEAEAIWSRFAELIPADQRAMVTGFELLDEDFGGAYVYPADDDPATWVLGVAPMSDESELDYVLIHEFGHLLTLQASQVPPDPEGDDSCDTYHTGEGCALSSSTMAEFVARFWPQERLDELNRMEDIEDEDEYYDAMNEFYERHRDEFVTDYAASNPAEDLAEVFAHFVLEERPSGSSIADEKVRLLWDDPSMVELRDQMRANARLS